MKRNPTYRRRLKRAALLVPAAVFIGCLASTNARAEYAATVLSDGPVAYYRLNDDATTPVPYAATNLGTVGVANNGAYAGSYAREIVGAMTGTKATSFTGGGWVGVPNTPSLNPDAPFSVEFWIKPTLVSGALTCPLSSTDFSVTPRLGWLFYTDNGYSGGYVNGGYYFRVYNSAGTALAVTSPAGILKDSWSHVVGVVDGVNIVLYVNGVAVGNHAWTGPLAPNVNQTIGIGKRYDAGFPQEGGMSDVAIYGTALSATEVKAHFDAATTNAAGYATQILAANPLGYWRLNEPVDPITVAGNSGSLGSAVNGSYRYFSTTALDLDSPTYPGFATDNRVLQTSGTNGIVAIPALNLNSSTVTFECWLKRNGPQASYAGVFFHRGSAGGTATGIDFMGETDNLGYHWNDQGNTYGWTSGLVPPDGAWAYVALAVSPDMATMYMYDGTTWSSAINAVAHPAQAFADITRLGADQDAARFFNGLIDEAAIYASTLTEAQLRTHALAGFGDPGHNPPTLATDPPVLSPSGTIYATTPFSLIADVYGEPPLTFQWQQDGANVPNGTTRTFARTAATASDAGNYAVIVGNAYGFVTSSIVNVTINPAVPPTITNQPLSRFVYAGRTASFTVGADGTTPMSYQWKHAGTTLPGATSATLIIPNCTATETGTYTVGVTNVAGGLGSASATLTLRTPPVGTFEEMVVANEPIAYWRLGETSGTTAFDYAGGYDGTYVNVTQGQTGAVSGDGNSAAGFNGADAYVGTRRGLLNGRAQFTVMGWLKRGATHSTRGGYFGQNNLLEFGDAGSGASIEAWIDATGANIITPWPWADNQWGLIVLTGNGTLNTLYVDGQPAATMNSSVTSYGTNAFSFNIGGGGIFNDPNVNGDWFNGYIDEVAVFDKALSADTVATLYAKAYYGTTTRPFVTRNPSSTTVAAGSTAILSASANGSLPLTYQWKKDGVNIAGATTAALSLPGVYFTDAGSYVLWVTNGVGFTNTVAATLTVMPEPTFANLTNDLVLHLRFDGDYADSSGRANDASAPGGEPPFLAGKIGQGVHVATTANANYLVISDNAGDLTFDENTSFTVGFWLKYTSAFNDVPIIGNAYNSTWQIGWVFTDSATAGKLEWSLASTANSGTYLRDPVPGCPIINDGTWHQVIGVVDRAAAEARVYVDGVLAGSWSVAGMGSLSSTYWPTIGSDPTGAYGSATFDMDDLGIWRRALTSYEAASIYGAAQNSGQSFDVYGPLKVAIAAMDGNVDVSWQAGTLLESTSITGPYTAVPGATAPFYRITPGTTPMFFRVQQ